MIPFSKLYDFRASMWDVFLSHNWREKTWVRCLYVFLCKKGLKVFFDEASIPPGANIATEIEKAIETTRHVILVLSPLSLGSRWVALETQLTIHSDPDALKKTLVPVVIEPVDLTKVRPIVRSLNCIDLTNPFNREERLRYLLHHIGLPEAFEIPKEELLDLLTIIESGIESELNIGGIGDVLEWGWDGIRLLEEFIRLDYQTIEELLPRHEGNPLQWAPVFMNHPDTWRMLFSEPKIIVGYWHFAPLFSDDYKLAKEGKLLDSEISADKVRLFEFPGHYEIYFVQICLDIKFRTIRNVRLLFDSVFQVLDRLSAHNIFVREVCANAYTRFGRSLCKSFNMLYMCEHVDHGSIFMAPINYIMQSPLTKQYPMLIHRYRKEGLL